MLTTETNAPRSTSEPRYTCEIPLGFNGYVTVAQPALRITAAELRAGDVLILDGYVSRVGSVRPINLLNGQDLTIKYPGSGLAEILELAPRGNSAWPVLHIAGDVNIVRFPHELVSVIRAA